MFAHHLGNLVITRKRNHGTGTGVTLRVEANPSTVTESVAAKEKVDVRCCFFQFGQPALHPVGKHGARLTTRDKRAALRWHQSPEYRLRGPNGEKHGLIEQFSVDVSARGAPKRFRSVTSEIPHALGATSRTDIEAREWGLRLSLSRSHGHNTISSILALENFITKIH